MNNTFLNENPNEGKIDEIASATENNSEYFLQISDKLVEEATRDLDKLMLTINHLTLDEDVSDNQLEHLILELSNLLYFMGNKLENMGVKDDLAKLSAKEAYNDAYLEETGKYEKKPTVAELTAKAEDTSRYETIMSNIYSRVYRQIKFKIDAAYEMLASLRKVLSKRMQDAQLSAQRNNGTLVIGSEEF